MGENDFLPFRSSQFQLDGLGSRLGEFGGNDPARTIEDRLLRREVLVGHLADRTVLGDRHGIKSPRRIRRHVMREIHLVRLRIGKHLPVVAEYREQFLPLRLIGDLVERIVIRRPDQGSENLFAARAATDVSVMSSSAMSICTSIEPS